MTREKSVLRGATRLTSSVRKSLKKLGYVIRDDGKHYRIYYGKSFVTMSRTTSDKRAGLNLAAELVKLRTK